MSPSSGGMGDLSMFDLFRMEIEGQTTLLSKDLLALEKDVTSATLLESVMRDLIPLKVRREWCLLSLS